MSSVVKMGGTWYIQFYQGGKKHFRTTRIKVNMDPKKVLARQVQRDFDTAIAKGAAGVAEAPITIEEGMRRYADSKRTTSPQWAEQVRVAAERWASFFKARRVTKFEAIRPEHITDFIAERQKTKSPKTRQPVSQKTIKDELFILRGSVKLLNDSRKIAPVSMAGWPTIRKAPAYRKDRIGAYSADEVRAIIEHLAEPRRRRWYLPGLFLAFTGCRYGEMARLTAGDVRGNFLHVESRKTATKPSDQYRMIEIHPRIKAELMPLVTGKKPAALVFPGTAEKHRDFDKVMRRTCEALGIQYRRVHGLRHTWITELLRAGVPVPIVMKMAGHTNMNTTMRYLTLDDGTKESRISALDVFDSKHEETKNNAPVSLIEYARKRKTA